MEKQIRITKENLIKDIAKQTKNSISHVRDIYESLECVIFDILSSVNEEREVCIKLFEGISIDGIYVPEKKKTSNLTKGEIFVDSRIKPKFNITRNYCEKLNSK